MNNSHLTFDNYLSLSLCNEILDCYSKNRHVVNLGIEGLKRINLLELQSEENELIVKIIVSIVKNIEEIVRKKLDVISADIIKTEKISDLDKVYNSNQNLIAIINLNDYDDGLEGGGIIFPRFSESSPAVKGKKTLILQNTEFKLSSINMEKYTLQVIVKPIL